MITLPSSPRTVKINSFEKLIDELKDKHAKARIRIHSPYTSDTEAFLRVIWSGDAGILFQDEDKKQFIAVDNLRTIESFEVSAPVLTYRPSRKYYL